MTTMNATEKPAKAGRKYVSAIDGCSAAGSGAAGGAGSTANEDTACDGQYDSEPANEA